MDNSTYIIFWYVVAMMLVLAARAWWEQLGSMETVPHSDRHHELKANAVQFLTLVLVLALLLFAKMAIQSR